MRLKNIGQFISIILRPNTRLPTLTCSVCGNKFYYRGIQDADCIVGSTWNGETFVPSGTKKAVCTECQRKGYE